MKAKSIYVDLDDVLSETGRTIIWLLQREFGKRVAFDKVEDYDLGLSLGLTPSELSGFMCSFHTPEVLSRIEPMRGAIETLSAWIEQGYEIEVVTGRPAMTREISRRWLETEKIPHHRLTFVDKYNWSDEIFSGPRAQSLDELAHGCFCLAIEDSAAVAARLVPLVGGPVVLFDRPWNRQASAPEVAARQEVVRCHDWQEIGRRFPRP